MFRVALSYIQDWTFFQFCHSWIITIFFLHSPFIECEHVPQRYNSLNFMILVLWKWYKHFISGKDNRSTLLVVYWGKGTKKLIDELSMLVCLLQKYCLLMKCVGMVYRALLYLDLCVYRIRVAPAKVKHDRRTDGQADGPIDRRWTSDEYVTLCTLPPKIYQSSNEWHKTIASFHRIF